MRKRFIYISKLKFSKFIVKGKYKKAFSANFQYLGSYVKSKFASFQFF